MPVKVATIRSPLDPDTAYRRIDSITRPNRTFWVSILGHEPAAHGIAFEGTMAFPSFKIMRIIAYGNAFLPVIRGAIRPCHQGSAVYLRMTLHPVVAVFMILLLCVVGAPVAKALLQWPTASIPAAPAGMFVAGVLLTLGGFFTETTKAEAVIRECVASRPTRG